MDTTFMNSKNSETSDPSRLVLNITDKINLKNHKNNKLYISAPTRSEKFDLPDGSYSISNTQDYFKSIIKKHEQISGNSPRIIYINKIEI